MRNVLQRIVGGPIGRLRYDMLELSPVDGPRPDGIREIGPTDLASTSVASLLATGPDHRARLASGDRAFVKVGPDDRVEGVVWLNLVGHDDRYGGRWTAAGPAVAYLNQLMVAPQRRGRGVGTALVHVARVVAAEEGRSVVRALVQPSNAASRATFAAEGARCRHHLVGLRVGRWGVRLRLPARATVA